MFDTLSRLVPSDPDYPERTHTLEVRRKVLAGSLYDGLEFEFHEERTSGGEYVPLRRRKPSVRYNLCRLVVQDTVALLFGEGRFPRVESPDIKMTETLAKVIKVSKLANVMLEAALRGSVGSVVVHMRVLKGRVFWNWMDTGFLTPVYDPEAPDTLQTVTERYKVRGDVLAERGYRVPEDQMRAWFWFQRIWDAKAETWFEPWPVMDTEARPKVDEKRTTRHGLGFVPMVWIKNMPGGEGIDGSCTFAPAIETSIEIDYQLSQGGRGLKYSSDPLMIVKEPTESDANFVRSGSNAMVVSENGDAKLLEISGNAISAVIEYARYLREMALESIHGNRANADRMSAAQSGRALEMMHQPLIWVADQLRGMYGEHGVLPLIRMVAMASAKVELIVDDEKIRNLDGKGLQLRWPAWFEPMPHDEVASANMFATLRDAGLMSRETGVRLADAILNVPDGVQLEVARILKDEAEARKAAAELPGAQSKVTENVPT